MPWKCQESCIRTQCFTKNVLDIVSTRLCFIHELWERVGMNSPHTNSHPQSPHFRFEKQIETGQTWCFCTKKKIDWAEATAKAYKWRLWNTGFWLAESIWSQPMALALRFAANPFDFYTLKWEGSNFGGHAKCQFWNTRADSRWFGFPRTGKLHFWLPLGNSNLEDFGPP